MADTTLAIRLAEIIGMFNNGESVNIANLAIKFNTSERTIQRDITQRLSFLHLVKSENHWKMDTSKIGTLSNKVIQNFAAISGIRELYPSLDDSFLKSLLNMDKKSAFLIKPYHYESFSSQVSKQLFNKLETAITSNKSVHFSYKEKDYQSIKPYKLINSKGIWYLAAIDNEKLKTFHVSQIYSLWFTNQLFDHNPAIEQKINAEESIWFSEEKYEVVLKVSPDIANYFVRRQLIPEQKIIKKCNDNSLIVTALVANHQQIIPIIKYWIPHVKVISPASLDVKLREDIKHYLNE